MIFVILALRIRGTDLRAVGIYDYEKDEIWEICVWYEDNWVGLEKIPSLEAPVTIIPVPSINGESEVEFEVHKLKRGDGTRKSK